MNDRLASRIARFIDGEQLVTPGGAIVVGVSGGPDSVALLHILNEIAVDLCASIVVAHVNYNLRGRASDGDEEFVRKSAKRMGHKFIVRRVARNNSPHPPLKLRGGERNLQEWARNLRYDFFAKTARKFGGSVVAVAHHQEDQCETVLMNIIRGSGPAGLCGMRPRRELVDGVSLIRPLLCVSRAEIEQYLERNSLEFRSDQTNNSDKFQRNRLRMGLIPALQKLNAKAVIHVCDLAVMMKDEMDAAAVVAEAAAMECRLRENCSVVTVRRDVFVNLAKAVRYHVLRLAYARLAGDTKGLTQDHVRHMDMIAGGSGIEYSLPGPIKFRREGNKVVLKRL